MEDHMTLLDKRSTGRSSVTTATDSMESDPNLCDRVKILEQKAGSAVQPESYLRNRIRLLERSERSLLLQLCQLASASHLPSMQHTQRLDQRLHMLREEVRTMTREKEQVDQVWRERLQRCQRQLKTKEEEMSRQSQYFENFKAQLQHKLSLAHNREQGLQSRISTLEKQLLDLTVSAATGTAAISAVRITAGTSTHWEEQERLTFMRGQGEGEEEKKEEIKKQWWPSVRIEREGGRAGDKGKTEKETEGGRNKDTRQNSNEARLQGFILSLQEDLRVLLEREEDGMTERRQLTEQLQEAQENSHFLSCKVEDMKAEVHQLKLSEHSLMEEVEQLRQKNHRLQQILREAANQTTSQSSAIPESTCLSPGPSSPSCSISKKVQPKSDDEIDQSHSPAVPPGHHQATAEATQNNTENHSSSAKSDPLKLSANQGSKPNPSFQSLTLTTETTDELTLGTWFSRGFINLQNSPSEESDALREAYRSLGLQEDLEALHEQGEAAMQHIQEQLQMMAQENSQLKLQLRKQAEEEEAEAQQGLSREKINSSSTCDGADHLQSSSIQDETILALAQNDLVQALNQENRALADRIQELLAHIELREEEMKTEESELKNHVSRLEEDRARLEQENQEQGCLITELTRKTEDDLNTIMELQQQLEKSGEQCNLEECIDSLVENVLKGAEPQLISSQQTDDLTTGSAPGFQHKNHYDPLQNSPQNTLHVSSSADQVDQLTKSIQTLKREQEELSGCINDLREQQREVALSVQTQTEEKQQLTRTVWGLKEEKDSISQSLAGLKQEREELNRIVCVLKDERDHFIRSMSGLKEEKEQLTKALSGLQREKEAMIESLSSGKEERDQIMQSVQGLQTENDQLKQAVLNLKQERDHLTDSLKCLKDQRDQEHSCYTLQEQCDKLMKSVSSLGEEKESIEYSVHCLRQEEKQMMLIIQGLREERNSLQTATGTGEYGNSLQEQRDLVREIEEELENSQVEVKKMDNELCQSEVRRVEAERKATQAAEKVMRLTDVANQMEETRKENERLNSQVKELQSKLIGLTREMSDALSLKIHIEEQYSVLTAQLKAKTVALEELNSEYIALKQGQGSKDDLSTALTSLRTHYNDIRAKYDALLKRKSQTDVDIAPLKAKLSCLVVKCQERNSLLLQLMKAMHRQGCVDSVLTQQVEQLLRDAALQDYSAAFTPGSNVNTQDCSTGFIPGFVSKFQDFTSGFTPDQTCSAVLPSVNKHHQTGFNSESDIKYRESGKHTSIVTSESTTNFQVCSHEITPTPIRAPKKNANSSVPNSPVKEQPSVQVSPSPVIPLKEGLSRNTTQQLSPSASGPVQATSGQKTFGFHDPNMKEKSSPDLTGLTESSLTSSPPPSSTHISPSRRLSSPEKIINLHEQLQKTLMSSYQVPVSRGRDRQSRKSLSFSAPADLSLASQTQKQNLSFSNPHNSLPVSTASSQSIHTSVVTAKPVATNKSATLFNAVASRSAHIEFSPNMFTSHHIKANMSKPTTSACSSSSNFPFATVTPSKAKSILSSDTNISVSPKPTKKITAIPDASYASHTSSIPLTLRPPGFDSNVLMFSDTNSKSTASDTAAFSISAVPKVNIFNMTSTTDDAPAYHGFVSAASCTQSAHRSPERPNKSARESTAALEKTKSARPKAEAPAEVRSVEVIKTVGQSSLMIGWERPPLDELGCSNGTFVYGYRVLIDGEFHKSVMSSACTKCILENVDLNVPVHISVQTLGSNGLSSNSVHTEYRTSVRTDQH